VEEKWKSRKFILALLLIAAFFALKIFNRIDNDNFSHVIIALFGIYCGSNVASKFTK